MALLQIAIVKAKTTAEVDTGKIPDDVVSEVWALGLKALANRGMTKVTKGLLGSEDAVKTEAMRVALENIQNIYAGKIRRTSGIKASKTGGEVMTEARQMAKKLVKAALKKQGKKVSYIAAKEITRLANQLIAAKPEIVEKAKAVVAARKSDAIEIDLTGVMEDADLVAKGEAKKAEAKAATAAKKGQAPVPPAKGQAPTSHATH